MQNFIDKLLNRNKCNIDKCRRYSYIRIGNDVQLGNHHYIGGFDLCKEHTDQFLIMIDKNEEWFSKEEKIKELKKEMELIIGNILLQIDQEVK